VEQIAFCSSHMIPGIEPSPDKILQVTKLMWQFPCLSADGGCGGGGSSSSSNSNSNSSIILVVFVSIVFERIISVVLVFVIARSSSFWSLPKIFNMYIRLGTSVRVCRHPALPSGYEPSAAASKLSIWVTWCDELPQGWRKCDWKSGWSTKLLPQQLRWATERA
jgi:hypothetical protein